MIHLHPHTLSMLKTMHVTQDRNVSDIHMVRRTIKERLFTFPWRPFTRYKPIYCPSAYVLKDGTVIVSPKTYRLLHSDMKP
jgi:hypothetical protein